MAVAHSEKLAQEFEGADQELPGELRNRIYRAVLVKPEGERVIYTASGHERPGLLATSKEIRAEAMSIFYCENEFITTINAYDSNALLKMAQCLQRLPTFEFRDFELKVYTETVFQSPSWKNLLTWMQRYHAHEVTGGIASPEDTLTDPNSDLHAIAVNSVFYVAESLRSLLWDQVEKIVTGMRPLLVKADARWGDD